jgi:DNA primase
MAIVEEDIERVRSAVSIVDIVSPYVQLKRVGRNHVGLCPFHAERTGSFNVRDEVGRYHCFGCGASGDVFRFVQEMEHVDFVASVEQLAAKAGITLRYTSGGEGRDRQHRKVLLEAMNAAVEWYHQRLLTAPDARSARDYLRSRGIDGDVARRFKLGWSPDDWDALAAALALPERVARETGLAFVNRRERLQDTFRARLMFPILNEAGEAVAFGGRVLPGSSDPAKYKNSPETAIYIKSKVLYGLNWAKNDVVRADRAVVCEGYTDVIGFHRASVPLAVATCGTALTADHVRLLKRFTGRVVLAFDPDAAGQSAAERFYEWERQFDVTVEVARLPQGQDPADLASSDPDALRAAVNDAEPFLGFRVGRVLRGGGRAGTPEAKAKLANAAMAVVNEHPDVNVRKLYAGQVAQHTGLPVPDLVAVAERRARTVEARPARVRPGLRENAEFVVLALLIQRWDEVAPWLAEPLFADEVNLGAFRVLADTDGDLHKAIEVADPEVRDLLERLSVADVDADPQLELRNLVGAATRRQLDLLWAERDLGRNAELVATRRLVEQLDDPEAGGFAAGQLLRWLTGRRDDQLVDVHDRRSGNDLEDHLEEGG